ncbi:hypothetical protein OESDEN_21559 [Oesophagostomum dentatum]|uniref:Glycosyl hydrolase family 31 C-terminal domain-containing protein n=1 Tax=Oesophagostomum dentatum TaxID=61180 RepID=A0A0B1S4K9_OESDE|nr:hypothetical protein OESDEN_21559 [Oesophagostomum dentatum]
MNSENFVENIFSLHFAASLHGGTVIRPVFYEYPRDSRTYSLSHQFFWGGSMLIAPVVYEGAQNVKAYLPRDDWYSLFDYKYGQLIDYGDQTFPAPWTSLIPVLVRGGSILPRQKPGLTTEASRKNEFELLIAPGAKIKREGYAEGFLYWDDGESVIESFSTYNYYYWKFTYASTDEAAVISIKMDHKADRLNIPTLDTVEIFNYNNTADFNTFKLNGKKVELDQKALSYNKDTKILTISKKGLIDLTSGESIELSWENVSLIFDLTYN